MPRGKRFSVVHKLFELLIRVPAWVGPLLAVGLFLVLFFLAPLFFRSDGSNALASGMAPAFVVFSKGAALVVGGAILLIWIVAELMKRARPRLLDRQESLDDIRRLPWQHWNRIRRLKLVFHQNSPSCIGARPCMYSLVLIDRSLLVFQTEFSTVSS
jgi:hypothetical protein